MYLHIGEDNILLQKNIIGIFDIEGLKIMKENGKFLEPIKDKIKEHKTIIITNKKGKTEEYFSNISVNTIYRRSQRSDIEIAKIDMEY